MSTHYGRVPLLLDNMEYLDYSKWGVHGSANGTVTASSGILTINNTSANAALYNGIYSLDTFPVGTAISVRSRGVTGRHHALIGFGASPYYPFPHAGTVPGCTWYSRADIQTSTLSWRSESGAVGSYDTVTENLTNFQVFKMIRTSSSIVEFYRDNILEYTATGLVLANDYSVYVSADGFMNPNTMYVDWISVA